VPEAVGRLVTDIEAELDTVVDGIVARIRDEIPDFRRLPASTLARAVRGNVGRALAALRDLRSPTADELERAAAVGRERAEQGLSVDAVLHAYRISISAVWSRFGELARERGTSVSSVLAFSETLWLWGDAVMEVVGTAHREIELQLAREEQQRRDAFVLAVLLGTIDADELSRESGGYGLDPEREYVAFRARALEGAATPRRLAADGLTTALDHDLVGLSTQPTGPLPGVVVGVGPPARLAALPAAFAMASRALQTALAFGQEGVFSLADLSIRPAILSDEALGEAFTGRHLEPLQALGRLGAELEDTLRVWFEQEMRIEETAKALHVHPNTLRHRLRRFEETTGANLRRPADLIELWWALERRRLGGPSACTRQPKRERARITPRAEPAPSAAGPRPRSR
jgi:PucR C-terminal helix-turn-helix domain